MNDETETIESEGGDRPHTEEHIPKKQTSGSSGVVLAMIVAIGAAAGSYYVWQQFLVAEQDRKALEGSIAQLLQVVEERDQAQRERYEQARNHHHAQLEQRLAALESSLPRLGQQLNIQQQQWSLAEVDYLLRTADERLQLHRDVPTAITALRQAREQLSRLDNGRFTEVVAAIDAQIAQLGQLETQTPQQITRRLANVIAAIETLPFNHLPQKQGNEEKIPTPVTEKEGVSGKVSHWGSQLWQDIRSLVTIRHDGEASRPLAESQRRSLLLTQLHIKLETARLAAMERNQALYRSTLDEAIALLGRHFDRNDPAVAESIATLDQLAGLDVSPELPSLSSLRQLLQGAQMQPSATAAPAMPPEAPAEEAPATENGALPDQSPDQPQWGREL